MTHSTTAGWYRSLHVAYSVLLLVAAQLGVASSADTCLATLDGPCPLSRPSAAPDILEAISWDELEAAEESEAEMMRLEMLQQTVQLQQHAPITGARGSSDNSQLPKIGGQLSTVPHSQHPGVAEESVRSSGGSSNSDVSPSSRRSHRAGENDWEAVGKTRSDMLAQKSTIPVTAVAAARGPSVTDIGAKQPSMRLLQGLVALVFLAALVVQTLVACAGRRGDKAKYPKWILPPLVSDCDIRSYIQQLRVSSASDLEVSSPPGGSSEGTFLKPLLSEGPVRLEARIEGPFAQTALKSPLTQRDCVMYSAAATHEGQRCPCAYASSRTDFIVSLADAPWVKILVEGADALCFGMTGGLWQHAHKSLEKAPDPVKDFIVKHMTESQSQQELMKTISQQKVPQSDARAVELEESVLVVDSIVTLVGKLYRGPGGQLSLQRLPGEASLPDTSWDTSSNASARTSLEPWSGKILVCDDPAFLSRKV